MALIKCSECGKEISDKAQSCPNCGCPVKVVNKNPNIYNFRGVDYDITQVNALISRNELIKAIKEFREITGADLKDAKETVDAIRDAKTYLGQSDTSQKNTIQTHETRCPNCGSANVKKNNNLLSVFLTNKFDRVCVNCKHKFKSNI
jgi:DNA-directed RNA polymerase subunit RPC12/RpoP